MVFSIYFDLCFGSRNPLQRIFTLSSLSCTLSVSPSLSLSLFISLSVAPKRANIQSCTASDAHTKERLKDFIADFKVDTHSKIMGCYNGSWAFFRSDAKIYLSLSLYFYPSVVHMRWDS
jgi:hypothetical protein